MLSGYASLLTMADGKSSFLPRGPVGVWHAFVWSLKGLAIAWKTESSFRLEVCLLVLFAPVGFWLGQNGIERAILIGSMLLVLSAELLNSSIEAVIERYGSEYHVMSGRAKDMGSAAVFVLMMNVMLCWGLLLIPRWLAH